VQQTSVRLCSHVLGLQSRILLLGELEGPLPYKAMVDHHNRLLPMAGLVREKSFHHIDQLQIFEI